MVWIGVVVPNTDIFLHPNIICRSLNSIVEFCRREENVLGREMISQIYKNDNLNLKMYIQPNYNANILFCVVSDTIIIFGI